MIGAEETVRVRYRQNKPEVESERRSRARSGESRQSSTARAGKRLSNAKREERERRQRWLRVRRVAVVAGAAAVVLACAVGAVALYNAPIFSVEKIVVEAGPHFDEQAVLALAKLPPDVTLTRVDAKAIRRRLESDPWVQEAEVDRDFPSTLRLRVVERRPAVVVDGGGTKLWVASADGRWLGIRSAEDTSLPLVRDVTELHAEAGQPLRDQRVLNAIKVIDGISPQLKSKVEFVSAPSVDETALHTSDDVEIFVGSAARVGDKDRIVREILRREKDRVVYINVRVVDRPTWRGLEDEAE